MYNRLFRIPLLVAAIAIILVGCASPTPTSATAAKAVPTANEIPPTPEVIPFQVNVSDLTVAGHCTGTRSPGVPVVVLQSGNGAGDSQLAGIEHHFANLTMVCAWSRPGAGKSETPANLPRPISEVVTEMHNVFTALKIEPPYFLIGQSAGGAVVFMFAQAYPNEVAGFVSMNPNPPYTKDIEAMAKVETPNELENIEKPDFFGENPERIVFTGNDRMLEDPLPGTMPYAVMFDEDCGGDSSFCKRILKPLALIESSLADVGDRGRFVWAKGAGHEIYQTQPQLVYDTIDEVWNEAVGTTAAQATTGIPTGTHAWTYVAFGDSWPYGAHCNGCTPFPALYAYALAATTDHSIDFINLTTNGGTSQSLLNSIKTLQTTRDTIMSASIIVISTGANDLEDAFGLFAAENCGGADQFDCFRKVGEGWRISFDGILTEIETLRNGMPTAIRLVTNSNEALSDLGLIEIFGPNDSSGGGAFITDLHHQILCEVAAKHGAKCVDLRPVLNGPNFDKPQDVNTQEAMQTVSDALLASGLDELR